MKQALDKDEQKVYRFVGVTFDQNCEKGEDILNQAINDGYKIAEHFRTEAGIVFSLVLDRQLVVDPNQRSLDYNSPVRRNTEGERKQ